MIIPDTYLVLHLQLKELRDKIQHPEFLTFQTQVVDMRPSFKFNSSKVSLTWTITFRKETGKWILKKSLR